MDSPASDPTPEQDHAEALQRHQRAQSIYIYVVFPIFAVHMLANSFFAALPVTSFVTLLYQPVLLVGIILLRRSQSRLMKARDKLMNTGTGLWCLECWYPAPATESESEFTCHECGALWETKTVRTYLEPPVKNKRVPDPLKQGETVHAYRWLAIPPHKPTSPDRIRRAHRRLLISLILLIVLSVGMLASVTVILLNSPRLPFGLSVICIPIIASAWLLARAFQGYIRDRNEYARPFDYLRCPSCMGAVEHDSDTTVACTACQKCYTTKDVRTHFQSSIKAWHRPSPLSKKWN